MSTITQNHVSETRDVMEENDLPEGWTAASLSSISAKITDGTHKTPDYVDDGIRFVSTANLVPFKHGFDFSQYERHISLAEHRELTKRCLPEAGDVLISKCGTIGRSKEIDVNYPFSIFVGLALLKPLRGLFAKGFLESFLNSPEIQSQFEDFAPGSTRRTLTLTGINRVELHIPPLYEQKRIVAKIDELFTQVNAARARLAKVSQTLKRFRQAVLAAACSGHLTEDWRIERNFDGAAEKLLAEIINKRKTRMKEIGLGTNRQPSEPDASQLPEVPEEWVPATMDQLTCLVTSGSRGWAKYYSDSGPIFIRAQDINTDNLILSSVAHVRPPTNAEGRRTRVQLGDLLVTITGANVTKSAVVSMEVGEAYVSQHVALIRPVERDTQRFLYLWTVSPQHGRAKLLEDAYGAGKPGLNLDNLKGMIVGVPPLDEQREIVRRVESLFKLADSIEKSVEKATRRADKLTQAILAKAFRGELVPTEAELARREGREYETAEQLLAHIRDFRKKSEKTKHSTKMDHSLRASDSKEYL